MNEPSSERTIRLQDSSWELLDVAAELDGDWKASEILDSLVQQSFRTDGGALVDRQLALAKIKKLFGDNRG
ncbi:MAG: hypothetical protein AAGI48_18355 [Verrucomicrobiota bacterium]